MGLPFFPVHGMKGTGYEEVRKDFVKMTDPYSGKEIFAVPSITPDVCLIHGLMSDANGNIVIPGSEANRLAALSARNTIASVEKIVDDDEFMARPGETFLSALHIDMVIEIPLGAHPTSCKRHYAIDSKHMETYLESSRKKEFFTQYLDKYVYSMTEEHYLRAVAKGSLSSAL